MMVPLILAFGIVYVFVGLLVGGRMVYLCLKSQYRKPTASDYLGATCCGAMIGLCWLPIAFFLWYMFGWKSVFEWWK